MHMIQSAEFKGFKKNRKYDFDDNDNLEDPFKESKFDSERKTVFLKSGDNQLHRVRRNYSHLSSEMECIDQ